MSKAVGIDLGTTNSLVAVVENGLPRALERNGERLIPSVVGLAEDGSVIVGQAALNQFVLAPERTIRSIKRKMGSQEIVRLGEREFRPEEISAFILSHLKKLAEEVLGETVSEAVITVPAYFNDAQRTATKTAGEMAGFEVLRIINEPTAAALAYGIEKQHEQFLLVYDLGGGTFDVSIIEQMGDILEVRASHGNVNLGGDDFDERLLQHLLTHLSAEHRYEFKEDRRAMARLIRAAEKTKIGLSDAPYAKASEEYLARYDGQIAHLNAEISREDFEQMIDDLLQSTLDSIDVALKDAELKPEQIQRALLVGGSTRIPRVAELVSHHIGVEPAMEINPDEAVALGAAVQAAIVKGEEVRAMLIDVSPHSLGISVVTPMFDHFIPGVFAPVIKRNTTIPTAKSERFHTVSPEQDTVEIEVYQGEHQLAADNSFLGRFKLTGIPPAPDPDEPREVIVEFSYNLNGIVEVTARDRSGQQREAMTISTTAGRRAASEPEAKNHFDPKVERDAQRALNSAISLESSLDAEGRTQDAAHVRKSRRALEDARHGDSEQRLKDKIQELEDLLYELEE